MNNDFNNIDDFLKQQVESSHFPVNEAHWEDALRRLNPEDDKKRPIFWFIMLGLVLGVSTLSVGLYNNYDSNGDAQELIANKNTVTAQYAVYNDIKNKEKSNQIIEAANEDQLNDELNKNNASQASINTTSAQPVILASNNNATQAHLISKKRAVLSQINTPTVSPKAAKNDRKTLTKINNNTANNIPSVALKRSGLKPIDTKVKANNKKPIMLAMGAPAAAKMAIENDNEAIQDIAKRSNTLAPKPRIYKSVEEMQAMNPRYVAGLENYNYEVTEIKLDGPSSDAIRARANAAVDAAPKKGTDQPIKLISVQQVERDFNSLFLIAGFSAAKGYGGNSASQAVYGLSPNLGFGYQLAASNKVNVYFSLFASYLNHLNISETSKESTYSFDKTTKEIEVARKNLIQLHMPVTVGFRLSERHAMLGGIGLIYGVNTLSTVNTNEQNVNEFGYMSGLRTMDANIHVGYEYKISDALRINMMYQEGLIDMTQNDYFNNNQEDRNRRISIGVRFNFDKR